MIVVRLKVRCQPDKTEQVLAAFQAVVGPSRAVDGVIHFDIARDIVDPDAFVATEVMADQAALERQESLQEVAATLGVLETALVEPPEATIYEVASSRPWE